MCERLMCILLGICLVFFPADLNALLIEFYIFSVDDYCKAGFDLFSFASLGMLPVPFRSVSAVS